MWTYHRRAATRAISGLHIYLKHKGPWLIGRYVVGGRDKRRAE